MKFKSNSPYLGHPTFESQEQYFRYLIGRSCPDGELETLRHRIAVLEEIIGRLLNHLPLTLEQLSDVVAGYNQELQELDGG